MYKLLSQGEPVFKGTRNECMEYAKAFGIAIYVDGWGWRLSIDSAIVRA